VNDKWKNNLGDTWDGLLPRMSYHYLSQKSHNIPAQMVNHHSWEVVRLPLLTECGGTKLSVCAQLCCPCCMHICMHRCNASFMSAFIELQYCAITWAPQSYICANFTSISYYILHVAWLCPTRQRHKIHFWHWDTLRTETMLGRWDLQSTII
jgi:hypothetical protein